MKTAEYAMAESLKKMLETKTLDHITVTDIAKDCNITRQAFYYHFSDIYSLLEWIYLQEAALLKNHRSISTWQEGYHLIMDWTEDNKNLVINTYRSINRDYLETFTYQALFPMLCDVVEELAKGRNVTKENKEFIARYYSLSLISITLDWVKKGMIEAKQKIEENVEIVMKDSIIHALDRYEQINS
jgi:Transcriptional regulator